MTYSEPKVLIQARELMEEAKFEEAFQVLITFKKIENRSIHDQISYYILMSLLLILFF